MSGLLIFAAWEVLIGAVMCVAGLLPDQEDYPVAWARVLAGFVHLAVATWLISLV